MEAKNWGEFEKNKGKLKNKCNYLFIKWQKTFVEKNSEKQTKKLKDKDNKVKEIRDHTEKIKKFKKLKNEKPIFK